MLVVYVDHGHMGLIFFLSHFYPSYSVNLQDIFLGDKSTSVPSPNFFRGTIPLSDIRSPTLPFPSLRF